MSHSAPPQDAVSVIAQEFLVDEPCAIAVDVAGAHVQMRPGPQEDRVEVDISVSGCPPERAEEILHRMGVGTRQMKDTVRVYDNGEQADAEWWRWIRTLDVTVHIDLRLPSRVEADLRVPGGEVDIANLQGHVDLQVMGGPCRTADLDGTLDIRAESSDVSIEGFSGDQVIARVATGSLTVNDVQADTITLRSVDAPVRASHLNGTTSITANSTPVELRQANGPCTARAQGGRLSYSGTPSHETELTVVGSTLDVEIPSAHPADLSITGDTLSLDEDFAFDGERSQHEVSGALNDGGTPLTLRAIGGTVRCHSSS